MSDTVLRSVPPEKHTDDLLYAPNFDALPTSLQEEKASEAWPNP